jgi:hypothetical protein
VIKTLRPLNANSTLKSGFLAVSLCHDLSNSELSTGAEFRYESLHCNPPARRVITPSFEIPA